MYRTAASFISGDSSDVDLQNRVQIEHELQTVVQLAHLYFDRDLCAGADPLTFTDFLAFQASLSHKAGLPLGEGFCRYLDQAGQTTGEPGYALTGFEAETGPDRQDEEDTVEYSSGSDSSLDENIDLRPSRQYVIPPVISVSLVNLRCGVCGRATVSGRVTQTRRAAYCASSACSAASSTDIMLHSPRTT